MRVVSGLIVAALLVAPFERSQHAAEASYFQLSPTAFHRSSRRRDRFVVASLSSTRREPNDSVSDNGHQAALKIMQPTTTDVTDEAKDDQSSKQEACVPCSSMDASFLLTPEQIQARLATLPSVPAQWKLLGTSSAEDSSMFPAGYDHVPLYLCLTFVAKNFQAAMDAMRHMGYVAERVNHHPDFHLTQYRTISVVLYTHKLMGVTEQDLHLARLFNEEVVVDHSLKWLKEIGGT